MAFDRPFLPAALPLLAGLPFTLAPQPAPQQTPGVPAATTSVRDRKFAMLGLPEELIRFSRVAEGGLHPRAVRDAEGRLHVVLYRREDDGRWRLVHARSEDDGTSFGTFAPLPTAAELTPDAYGLAFDLTHAGGALHVVWTEPAPGGGRVVRYARRPDGAGEFAPATDLAPGIEGIGVGVGVAARGDRPEETRLWVLFGVGACEAWPAGQLFAVRSTDGGAQFEKPRPVVEAERGCSEGSAVDAVVGKTGKVFALYRGREGKRRDLRMLVSHDGGESFEDKAIQFIVQRNEPHGRVEIVRGGSGQFTITAWEDKGVVVWSYVKGKKDAIAMPIAPKPRPQYVRRSPTLATNRSIGGLLAWIEKERGTEEPYRLAWQAWDITGRRPIGRGVAPVELGASTPQVVLRSDEGFTVLY